jgi:hypothetical protein
LPLYAGLSIIDINIIEIYLGVVQALKELETEACLGFGTVTKPIFREDKVCLEPTLIQLVKEAKVFLLPTRFSFAVSFAVSLAWTVLCNQHIQKAGFGIKGDDKELRNKLQIHLLC